MRLNDLDEASAFIATLQDAIVAHTLTATTEKPGYAETFYVIISDTDFARRSTGGILQYELYCTPIGQKPNIDDSHAKDCYFCVGSEVLK